MQEVIEIRDSDAKEKSFKEGVRFFSATSMRISPRFSGLKNEFAPGLFSIVIFTLCDYMTARSIVSSFPRVVLVASELRFED